MSYTPAADLEFSAASYTPDAALDFSEPALEVALGQRWAVDAYQFADAIFDASWANVGGLPDEIPADFAWAVDAPTIADLSVRQAYALDAYAFADRPASDRWTLDAPTIADGVANQRWGLDVLTWADHKAGAAWAIAAPAVADGIANQRWALAVVSFADRVAAGKWSIVAPTVADGIANQWWRVSAYAMTDRPANGRWAILAPAYGDRPVVQCWAQPGATIRDCVVWHGWALTAATLKDRPINQRWAVPAAGFGNYPADQRWTLNAYAAGDRAFSGSWRVASMSFGDRPADGRWSIDVPEHVVQTATPWAWAIQTVTVRDVVLNFRHAQTGAIDGLVDFEAAWAVEIADWAEFDGSWAYQVIAPTWDDWTGDQWWVLDAPNGGDIVQWQLWAQRGSAVWTPVVTATAYTLTLTGAPDGVDDIVLPMASFSTRLSRDGSSYLQVSVPNGRRYAADIAARMQGELVISRGVRYTDDRVVVDEIARAWLSLIQPSFGGRSSSVSLQGRRDPVATTPRSVVVSGVSSWSLSGGKNRWRARISNDLRPGDTAVVDGRSAVIGEIVHTVNASTAYMDIAEA